MLSRKNLTVNSLVDHVGNRKGMRANRRRKLKLGIGTPIFGSEAKNNDQRSRGEKAAGPSRGLHRPHRPRRHSAGPGGNLRGASGTNDGWPVEELQNAGAVHRAPGHRTGRGAPVTTWRVGVCSMSQKSAKKHRREQRIQQEQQSINSPHIVEDLETLLKTGEIDAYAQICWTLAENRDEAPIAGGVVTFSGPCEEHGPHEKSFRLTPQTLMTLAQLTGMETCEEAIRLVAKKLPPEKLPCYPHGHGQQAYDHIMFGIEPDECTYCGEKPEFILPSKSIGWPDEIPVKGIDGQEYKNLPQLQQRMPGN